MLCLDDAAWISIVCGKHSIKSVSRAMIPRFSCFHCGAVTDLLSFHDLCRYVESLSPYTYTPPPWRHCCAPGTRNFTGTTGRFCCLIVSRSSSPKLLSLETSCWFSQAILKLLGLGTTTKPYSLGHGLGAPSAETIGEIVPRTRSSFLAHAICASTASDRSPKSS